MASRSVDADTLAPPSASTTRGDTFTKDDELKKDNTYVLSDTEDGDVDTEAQPTTDATDNNPETTDQNPDAKDQNQDVTDQNPGTTDQNPGTTDQNPEARDQNPEARDKNSDGTDLNPGTTDQNQDATDQNQDATDQNPESKTASMANQESESTEKTDGPAKDENHTVGQKTKGETNAEDHKEGNLSSADDNVNKEEESTHGVANDGEEMTNQEEAANPEVDTVQEAEEGKDNAAEDNVVAEGEQTDEGLEMKNGGRSRKTWLEKKDNQSGNTDETPKQADEGDPESERTPVESAGPEEIGEGEAVQESQSGIVPTQDEETEQVSDPNKESPKAESEQEEDGQEMTDGNNEADRAVGEGNAEPHEITTEQIEEKENGEISSGETAANENTHDDVTVDDQETGEKVEENDEASGGDKKTDVDDDASHVSTPSPRHGDDYVQEENDSVKGESEKPPQNEGIPEIVVQKADTQSTLKTQSEKSHESLKTSISASSSGSVADDPIPEKDADCERTGLKHNDDDHSSQGKDCDWEENEKKEASNGHNDRKVDEHDDDHSGTDSKAEEPVPPKSTASSRGKSTPQRDDQANNGDADVESGDSINLSQHSEHGSPPDTSRSEYLLESMHSNAHYILDSVHTVRKENKKMKEENDKLRAEKSSLRAELKKLKSEADTTKKELNERIMELEGDLDAALERINKFESLVLNEHDRNSKRTSKRRRRRRRDSTESSGRSSQASPDLGRRGLRVSPEIHMHVHGHGLSADSNAQSASAASASLEQYLKLDIRRLEEYNDTLKRSLEQEIEKRSMVQKLLEEVMETNEAFKSQFEKWQKSNDEHEQLKREYAELEQKYKTVTEANMNMNVALLELQPSDKPLLPSLQDKFSSKTGDLISRIEAAEVELRDSKRRVSSLEDYLRNLYSGELKIKFSPSNGDRPIFTLPDIDEKKKRVDVNGPHNAYSVMARKRKFKK